jgi:hypothetical protein
MRVYNTIANLENPSWKGRNLTNYRVSSSSVGRKQNIIRGKQENNLSEQTKLVGWKVSTKLSQVEYLVKM